MRKYIIPQMFKLEDVPEFQRFQENNPKDVIDEQQAAITFGRAIHWLSIYQILWPPFEKVDCYFVEVGYIVINDPDEKLKLLPNTFYQQIAVMLKTFWTIQLSDLYPEGDWDVVIHNYDGEEILVQADIRARNK